MNSVHLSTLRRTAAAVKARRYIIVCVCLLAAAVALRFYDISKYGLKYDEALAAINSRGALSEVIDNTRYSNSSPILYPIALWAVQKAQISEFSVRLIPAAASALTVGTLLFWMPRLGVPRRAAFLAALLCALSVAAIEHAQNSREYSVDALLALLMIVGLLQYLRDGGKWLLCVALLVGPLLQYGLALFGVAVIGAAALAPSKAAAGVAGAYAAAVWRHIKRRIDLLLPIACFGAACAASWELTLRYQWMPGGWNSLDGYLTAYYYQSGYDAAAVVEFAVGRTWDLVSYHMPTAIAAGALAAFGAALLQGLMRRRRLDALGLLALFAVGVAFCAALASAYPLGGIRQCLYLGPVIFLAAGGAFHSLVEGAAAARRAWVASALGVVAAGTIALVGAAAIRQDDLRRDDLHYTANNIKQVLAALDEREQEGDGVYVYRWAIPSVEFYKGEKPDNYFYEQVPCHTYAPPLGTDCVHEALGEMFRELNEARRIWLIHNVHVPVREEIAAHSQEISVEEIDDEKITPAGWNTLHLITDFHEFTADIREEWLDMYDAVASEAPSAVAAYNLYLQDEALYYAKRPCDAADTEAKFFLHIYPADVADLPDHHRRIGLNNLDFDFQNYGFLADGRCIIRRALPNYPIERIHTGQFIYPDGAVTWEADFPFKP